MPADIIKIIMARARNYQLIELPKPAAMASAGQQLPFGDQPNLRTIENRAIQITHITAFSALNVPVAPSGNPVCDDAAFANAFLVLNVNSYDKFKQVPLVELNPIIPDQGNYTGAVQEFFELISTWRVDWTKSYLFFAAAPAGTLFSYLFGVRYLVFPDDFDNRSGGLPIEITSV